MRRIAYLLANTDGLPGTKKDVDDLHRFLISCSGGAWEDNEIVERYNARLSQVRSELSSIKMGCYDYVVFYYSGHGAWERSTHLYINETDEYVSESETRGLSQRQLSIFDCCRVGPQSGLESKIATFDEAINSQDVHRRLCREKFDRLIKSAAPQEIRLYACKVGQSAVATGDGSLYTQALLDAADSMGCSQDLDPIGVHNVCCEPVTLTAAAMGFEQSPDCDGVFNCAVHKPLVFAISRPSILFG